MANGESKLAKALVWKKEKAEEGWLRKLDFSIDPASAPKNFGDVSDPLSLQLAEQEKEKALKLLMAIQPNCSANSLVAHAWGANQKTISRWCQKLLQNNGSAVVRKQRSDTGKTLFNSQCKRLATFSPCFVFDQTYSAKDVQAAWTAAGPRAKEHCRRLSKEWIEQGPFLVQELQKALLSAKGSVSWEQLATNVAGTGNLQPVGKKAIRK